MIYPLRLFLGRGKYYISMTYSFHEKYNCMCRGWGIVYSDCIFSLGDRLLSYRFLSSEKKIKTIIEDDKEKSDIRYYFSKKCSSNPILYYFIDFSYIDKTLLKDERGTKKILKSSLDIRDVYVSKRQVLPLILVANNDLIIGKGELDFASFKISIDLFKKLPFKMLGFYE